MRRELTYLFDKWCHKQWNIAHRTVNSELWILFNVMRMNIGAGYKHQHQHNQVKPIWMSSNVHHRWWLKMLGDGCVSIGFEFWRQCVDDWMSTQCFHIGTRFNLSYILRVDSWLWMILNSFLQRKFYYRIFKITSSPLWTNKRFEGDFFLFGEKEGERERVYIQNTLTLIFIALCNKG